jgi:hypothetical protein
MKDFGMVCLERRVLKGRKRLIYLGFKSLALGLK